jgi:RNA polymerase sigma factor FliA
MASAAKLVKQNNFVRRDELILSHLNLVNAIALRVHESLPVHVELDDLIHAGVMGLFDAATKYRSDKQVVFSAYAKHRIKGAILDNLRSMDWASRDMRKRQKQLEQVTRELTTKLQRDPTEAEVAEGMGVSLHRWRQMMGELRTINLAATQNQKTEREEQPAIDPPCGPDSHPDEVYAKTELRKQLGTALGALPRRYQQVIELYYDRDMTMKEIGAMLGVNESRVSQMHKAALARMQTALQSNGIQSAAAF